MAPRLLLPAFASLAWPAFLGAATFSCVSTLSFKLTILSALLQSRRAQVSLFMSLLSPDITIEKARLRLKMKAHRANLAESERARASQMVCEILNDWLQTRAETRIAIYLARPVELNLDALASELLNAGRIVCAPRLDAATSTMRFHRLPNLDAIRRGAYDVREPIFDEIILPEIVLVPGLAFDRRGCRLGMGGGWYDRVLAQIPIKIGVCFRGQIADEVPIESHDIKMDWLASEAGLVRCGE